MPKYADLEMGLHRWDSSQYTIDMRFHQPHSDGDNRLVRGGPCRTTFDLDQLDELRHRPDAYGQALSAALFGDEQVRAGFDQARKNAQALDAPLRVRLFIGPTAPELHGLRWETLQDADGASLLMSEHLFFSRYLSSDDWQPLQQRARSDLHALALIANPANLGEYNLAPVDVASELERLTASLGDIPMHALTSPGQATLKALFDELDSGNRKDRPYDILYIVCHGSRDRRGEPVLWMEDASGKTSQVAGQEFVTRLRELRQRPRLVVLASCQSAGASSDNGVLSALGPRLAETGIPAVIAMQGNISMQTVAEFMPVFFRELLHDGQIDRAMARARGAVRQRADAWMPVLFMRLKSGQIWYVPGFGDERQNFQKWPVVLRNIQRGRCTPIIGPRVSESLIGSPYEIASKWAETYHFPMQPRARRELAQVAQYVAINQSSDYFPHEELIEYLRQDLLARYGDELAPKLRRAPLSDLFAAVGEARRTKNPDDPYKVLAELPLPIYVTTNLSNMLTEGLRAAGKDPQVEICRWNEFVADYPSIYEDEPDYEPDEQRPLVYHLFGISDEPASLVLTEDDYFNFLISVSANKELIPIAVRQALVDTALLFLGFRIDDWGFRVILHSIMKREGSARQKRHPHIAAQVLPEEDRFQEPEAVCSYLESYFQRPNISIFWGSTEDFIKELRQRLQ